ncbi:hypothetical protein [Streptomyces sp. A5-4]|uniref:hypothetical protein n=1 Tax=Streptomyces sp. A5-4 TaxID=3384771 RepID=UPI003DA93E5E
MSATTAPDTTIKAPQPPIPRRWPPAVWALLLTTLAAGLLGAALCLPLAGIAHRRPATAAPTAPATAAY